MSVFFRKQRCYSVTFIICAEHIKWLQPRKCSKDIYHSFSGVHIVADFQIPKPQHLFKLPIIRCENANTGGGVIFVILIQQVRRKSPRRIALAVLRR